MRCTRTRATLKQDEVRAARALRARAARWWIRSCCRGAAIGAVLVVKSPLKPERWDAGFAIERLPNFQLTLPKALSDNARDGVLNTRARIQRFLSQHVGAISSAAGNWGNNSDFTIETDVAGRRSPPLEERRSGRLLRAMGCGSCAGRLFIFAR
jgi:hypothetical protein